MSSYLLPSTDDERARLTAQALTVNRLTRRLYEAAGLAKRMRVLDVGSGAGDDALRETEISITRGEVTPAALSPLRREVMPERRKRE